MKLFIRTDKETIENAFRKTLPAFLHTYKGVTSEVILTEAYHSIRNSITSNYITNDNIEVPEIEESIVTTSLTDVKPVNLTEVTIKKEIQVLEEVKTPIGQVKSKVEEVKKFNKKGTLMKLFSEGKTVEECIELIVKEYNVIIDKSYATSVYKYDFKK